MKYPRIGRAPDDRPSLSTPVSFVSDDSGQTAVEYGVIVFFMVVVLVGVPELVIEGLAMFYREVTTLLSLPIP